MTVAVRTGSLRHRLTFKEYVRTADGIGGFSRVLSQICQRWGKIKPTTGFEPFISDNLRTVITHTAEIRTLPIRGEYPSFFTGCWWGDSLSGTAEAIQETVWFSMNWWGKYHAAEIEKLQSLLFFFNDRMFKIHGFIRPEEQQGLITILCSEVVE